MSEHRFGGPWTEVKLDAVEFYLQCYTRALSSGRFNFELWYIDAFAGSGSREANLTVGGIFEGRPIENISVTLAGSARRAIGINPPFSRLVFIESDPARCQALSALDHDEGQTIEIVPRDANVELKQLVRRAPWVPGSARQARGVVFLDPYALQVEWDTLRCLAQTGALDVWYLFPLRDTIRQLAHDFSRIGVKEGALDRLLGPEWRELYTIESGPIESLDFFDEQPASNARRAATPRQIEAWVRKHLQSIFKYVSEPLPILTTQDRHAFSLFLCVSSQSEKATKLAEHFYKHVLRKYGPAASRRKSGR